MSSFVSSIGILAQAPAAALQQGVRPWLGVIGGALVLTALLLVFLYRSRAGVIARATIKEAIRQPVYLLLLILVSLFLFISTFVPYFTMGDDVKVLKDVGLAALLVAGLLLAVWTASVSIAEEIEGKTAMTLLSKPINRRQFVIGKYIGILTSTVLLMLPLIGVLLLLTVYKTFYDARETPRQEEVTMVTALAEAVSILPGAALTFMEISVLAAISVAISTRLPMVVNMVACFAIFVVGHLTTTLVQSGVMKLELVQFMARIIATVMPALDSYNIGAAIATDTHVPPSYIALAGLYTLAYSAIGILLALLLFEDRDLA